MLMTKGTKCVSQEGNKGSKDAVIRKCDVERASQGKASQSQRTNTMHRMTMEWKWNQTKRARTEEVR